MMATVHLHEGDSRLDWALVVVCKCSLHSRYSSQLRNSITHAQSQISRDILQNMAPCRQLLFTVSRHHYTQRSLTRHSHRKTTHAPSLQCRANVRQASVLVFTRRRRRKRGSRRANRQTSDRMTGGEAATARTETLTILFVAASCPQNNRCPQSAPSKSVSVL